METIIDNSKFVELKSKLEDRKQVSEETRGKPKELEAKFAEIKMNLPSLKTAVQDAETRKETALNDFVMVESLLPQLEKVREVFGLAKKTESEAMELLEATERALPQMQQKIVEADRLFLAAKHKLWSVVSEELGAEAREKVSSLVEQAWGAKLNSEGGLSCKYISC